MVHTVLGFFRETYFSRIISMYIKSKLKRLETVSKRKKILELGCGTGSTMIRFSDDYDLYGMDLSKTAISVLNRRDGRIKTFNEDVLSTRQGSSTYDLVFSQGLIEHFRDPYEFIKESSRITKKGGLVIVIVASDHPFHYLFYKLTRPKSMRFLYPWDDVIPPTIEENMDSMNAEDFFYLKKTEINKGKGDLELVDKEIVPKSFGLLTSFVFRKR